MRGYQSSFTAGELSPSLLGRVDLGKYQSGCKTLTNMLVHPQGGASKRPGFEFVAEVPGETHLLPFIFNNEQSYVLAFTDYELRIYTQAGLLQTSEHGGWQDSQWKNEKSLPVDTPQSGSNEGLFQVRIRPQEVYWARAESTGVYTATERVGDGIFQTVGALIPKPESRMRITFTGANIRVVAKMYAIGGNVIKTIDQTISAGTRDLSWGFLSASEQSYPRGAKITVTLHSSGTSRVTFFGFIGLTGVITETGATWSSGWANAGSDSNTSISSSSAVNVNLFGKIVPQVIETLMNEVHVEEPGAAHPIRVEVVSGSVRLQVGTTKGGSDLLPSTFYAAGAHELTLHPAGKSMFFTFSGTDNAGGSFYPTYLTLGDGGPIVLETPYTLEQAKKISYAQSADVLFMACRGIAPQKLMRFRHDSWELQKISCECPVEPPASVSATKAGSGGSTLVTPYTYVVTAVNSSNKESYASSKANVTGPASNDWKAGDRITISWAAVPEASEYRVYKSSYGGSAGFMASTSGTTYDDTNISPVSTDGPPLWTNPFPDGDCPSVVGMFEQRLVFASTPKRPQTIWLSRAGDYENFSASRPVKADDSIEATIASSEVSTALWMVSLRSLMLGTTNVEWEISSREEAFTAKTMKVSAQSYRGSASLPALIIGNSILHVARNGSEVRDLKYDFGSDSYGGSDRSVMAGHLLSGRSIVQWTYQPAPDSIVWAVRDDGALLGLTYQAEHEIFAWHKHNTQGKILSICCVPQGSHDFIYIVAKRENGCFLEMMSLPYSTQVARLAENEQNPLASALYLDSALEYSGEPTQKLSGLDHLEGMEVGILADGAVMAPRTVQNGEIELDAPASKVKVGLAYSGQLETMPIEIVSEQGSSMTRKKRVTGADILLYDTVSAAIGLHFDRLENIKWRSIEPMGSPLEPRNKWHHVNLAGLSESMATICVESKAPLPLTVLALTPEFDVN